MRSYQSDRGRRGAALIIAIAIMTILLAIALTFFAVTRIELRTATNVTNTVRVEFLADSGVAMGVATLNQDFLAHPAVSSLDHPWRSIYSGAAFAGKPWTWRGGVPLTAKGVPEIDLNLFPYVDVDGDGAPDEPLYRGPRTRNWLFIPRVENLGAAYNTRFTPVLYSPAADLYTATDQVIDLTNPGAELPKLAAYRFFRYDDEDADNVESLPPDLLPFATPRLYGRVTVPGVSQEVFDRDPDDQFYTKEMVDLWADIDNDGDGLKDSIWIPVPIDQFFPADGMDNDLDGYVDEQQDNRSDDDGDGFIEGIDTDGDGIPDDEFDPDEAIEAAPFVYYTGDDGLDNDGDGFIDREDCPDCTKTFPDGTTQEAQPPFEFDPLYDPLDPPTVLGSPGVSKLGYMLAAPLPGMRIKIDVDADGIVGDVDDVYYQEVILPGGGTEVRPFPAEIVLPPTITVMLRLVGGDTVPLVFTEQDVDTIDNDYDLLVNNFNVYAYLISWDQPEWRPINDWEHNFELCQRACDSQGGTAQQIQLCKDDCVRTHMPWFAQGADPFGVKLWLEEHDAAISLSYNEICTGCYFPELYETDLFPETPDGARQQGFENPSTAYRLRITMTGEPACTLAGRAAVLITDEQSKVNLNVAGAQTYDPFGGAEEFGGQGSGASALYRALADGVTTAEYETRALPDIGVARAQHLWQLLTGAPKGVSFDAVQTSDDQPQGATKLATYLYDVSLPGFGRVDDNGNALLLSLNGINDNADRITPEPATFDRPIADEGLRTPRFTELSLDYLSDRSKVPVDRDGDSDIDEFDLPPEYWTETYGRYRPYTLRLGLLEGIDEPGEMQRFRPLRNDLAERDVGDIDAGLGGPLDNDSNEVANELGELGDRNLRTREQIEADLDDIGEVRFNNLKNIVSVHAADKNLKYYSTLSGIKTTNKVDLNFAPPQQIAATMLLQNTLDSPLDAVLENPEADGRLLHYIGEIPLANDPDDRRDKAVRDAEARRFAEGLLQADTNILAPRWRNPGDGDPILGSGGFLFTDEIGNTTVPAEPATRPELDHRLPADPVLGAMQAAVDAADSRDGDHARSVLTTENVDSTPPTEKTVAWPDPKELGPRERLSGSDLFDLGSIDEYINESLEPLRDVVLERIDSWWANLVQNQPTSSAAFPEERRISYTVSGTEAVRINEIMVRPVRRVEAEATPDAANFPIDYLRQFDPTPFTFPFTKEPTLVDDPTYWDGSRPAAVPVAGEPANPIISELPEFIMQRRSMRDFNDPVAQPDLQFFSSWRLATLLPNPVLGDGIAWIGGDQHFAQQLFRGGADGSQLLPDAIEYLFVASEGLPEGRYYLTVNVKSPDVPIPSITGDHQMRYSIKYVPVRFEDDGSVVRTGPTILDDILTIAAGAPDPLGPDSAKESWWEDWQDDGQPGFPPLFERVTDAHIATGADRKRAGWIFLDGSAEPFAQVAPDALGRGYYERGIGESANDIITPPPPTTPETQLLSARLGPLAAQEPTHTILVPPPPLPRRIDPVTGDVLEPVDGWALCVALMLDLDEENEQFLLVNFFDFSQEPDHEWVELVNVSNEPVDISGWELEIGIPDAPGALHDPNTVRMTIPPGNVIAPQGTVLVYPSPVNSEEVDKFDWFQLDPPNTAQPLLLRNGIGLARGVYDTLAQPFVFANVTVPPFVDDSQSAFPTEVFGVTPGTPLPFANLAEAALIAQHSLATDVINDLLYVDGPNDPSIPFRDAFDPTHSVFDRVFGVPVEVTINGNFNRVLMKNFDPAATPADLGLRPGIDYAPLDYIDRDGDGQNDVPLEYDIVDVNGVPLAVPNGYLPYPTRASVIEYQQTSSYGLQNPPLAPNRSWDRIIPAVVSDDRYRATTELNDIIDIVLQGGIFPNYPEHDGIDNDGDGPYQSSLGDPIPGVLARDMVDNNLNGVIDEPGEGIDEGAATGAGTYGPGTLPVVFFRLGGFAYDFVQGLNSGQGIDATSASDFYNVSFIDSNIARMGMDPAAEADGELNARSPYVGTDVNPFVADPTDPAYVMDPPAWKAFVQRRWYPGDNVTVTLYEGQAVQGRVADRVTYNELDVVNRSVDDIRVNPYAFDDTGAYTGVPTLNPDYPTLWLPNQMGLDFYKSLERKHPLYNGDRFGTQNRWQATDGNYDDWADSLLPWQRLLRMDGGDPPIWPYRFEPGPGHLYRFDSTLAYNARTANEGLLRHAMSGSPLRYNYTHRLTLNPSWDDPSDSQFALKPDYLLPWDRDAGFSDSTNMKNPDWGLLEAEVRDGNFVSPGDLLRLPHPTFEVALFNNPYLFDPLSGIPNFVSGSNVNVAAVSLDPERIEPYSGIGNFHEDRTLRTAVLGQAIPESGTEAVLAQATGSAAMSPLTLTMAQAKFTAILPDILNAPLPPDIPSRDNVEQWYLWKLTGDPFRPVQAPRGWAPVYLFGDVDEDSGIDRTQLPQYTYAAPPISIGGPVPLTQWPFLLNEMFFLTNNDRWTDTATRYRLDHYLPADGRWPLEDRIVGFVSDRHDPYSETDLLSPPEPITAIEERRREEIISAPEALFEWGPEDGIENGEYTVYIGTFIPGLRQALARTDKNVFDLTSIYLDYRENNALDLLRLKLGAPAPNWVESMVATNDMRNWSIYGELWEREPDGPDIYLITLPDPAGLVPDYLRWIGRFLPEPLDTPTVLSKESRMLSLLVEVITDPTKTGSAMPPPLVVTGPQNVIEWNKVRRPGSNPISLLHPNTDGYMLYTEGDDTNWEPRVVEVRNNYLAIRVRNVSPPGQPVLLTHVVLAPRRNTPGRLNVNTADMSMRKSPETDPTQQELFNPLIGLPGMIDAMTNAERDDPVDPPNIRNLDPQTLGKLRLSPTQIASGVLDPFDPMTDNMRLVPPERRTLNLNVRGAGFETRLDDRDGERAASLQLSAMIQEGRPEHADGRYYENPVQLAINGTGFPHPEDTSGDIVNYIFPLSNMNDPQVRFQQMADRFRRMANMLTTRSDLYEIIVTAQSGYGLDMDGDGFINYRSNDEFVTTAESKVRSVYERRSPRPNPASPEQTVP